ASLPFLLLLPAARHKSEGRTEYRSCAFAPYKHARSYLLGSIFIAFEQIDFCAWLAFHCKHNRFILQLETHFPRCTRLIALQFQQMLITVFCAKRRTRDCGKICFQLSFAVKNPI